MYYKHIVTSNNSSLFAEFLCKLWFFDTSAKKAQLTHERVEYNVFFFDEPLKGSKSLKIFKISLTFCFDKFPNSDSVEQKTNLYYKNKNTKVEFCRTKTHFQFQSFFTKDVKL
jgi:hypothetical protein